MSGFLTAADAAITLAISGLFDIPQQLQGFSAQNVYETPDVDINETLMGVDGFLSGGYVANPTEQTFELQADSNSNKIFQTWAQTMIANKAVYIASGRTELPSLGEVYISTRGFLISYPPMATVAKIVGPRKYRVRWQSVVIAPA